MRWLVLGASLLLAGTSVAGAAHAPYEGFGAATRGGGDQTVYRVTSLADAGPGTLRDALSHGGRLIRFDVAGEIALESRLYVAGPFVTIDGLSAPAPGITLTGWGLGIMLEPPPPLPGGAHDVVVRGIRIRNAAPTVESADCISIAYGAYRVVVDHVSTAGCGDGAIDVTNGARDVTVQWSILDTASEKTMLVYRDARRISVHHNLFAAATRNPKVANTGFITGDTIVDMRNNLVWNWAWGEGTHVRDGAWVNVVGNVYGNPAGPPERRERALTICRGDGIETPATRRSCARSGPAARALGYVAGNVSLDGVDVNAAGTVKTPFRAPRVTTTDACDAGEAVVSGAGARPLDATDERLLASIVLSGCRDADR